jgi:DNA-binding MurR/RpiR family transcriptional regulator
MIAASTSKMRSSAQVAGEVLRSEALGYSTPRTYEELRAVLSSGSTHLPKRLREVAIFVWQHPAEVALGSIISVAEQAGVQPSTLVRFAKTFGYAGFSEFQDVFKEHMKIGGLPVISSSTVEKSGGGERVTAALIDAAQRALTRLDQNFDEKSYRNMLKALNRAEIIYLIGSKRAFPVVTYMSMTLSQQGIRNCLVDNVGSLGFDQISCCTKRDAVIAINFSPYNSITPDLVEAAKQNGATVTAITDSTFSPLTRLADHIIEVVEMEYAGFRTLTGTMTVAASVVMGLARMQGK